MRPAIDALPGSLIREVANAGWGRADVLAFWFGESDEVTPEVVREAAIDSLQAGETFYSHNLGLPALRQSLARYVSSLHPSVDLDRIAVTSSGVSALMLAMQLLLGAGDEVVAVTPVWPNLTAQPLILGARVTRLSLRPGPQGWTLDLDTLRSVVTSATRVLLLNAPNNPTGWTLEADEQRAILEHCRQTGTWIVADEVYERLYFGKGGVAPSFLDVASSEDRLVVVQSFSKSFLMTGWRLGWLVVPPDALDALGRLTEFNTSCAPVFVQRAALRALEGAQSTVPALTRRLHACRDRLIQGLQSVAEVQAVAPRGGMYAFFRLQGCSDSLQWAKRLVRDQGLGLAPGVAFGPEAEGWMRWCFASSDPSRLDKGLERLQAGMQTFRAEGLL